MTPIKVVGAGDIALRIDQFTDTQAQPVNRFALTVRLLRQTFRQRQTIGQHRFAATLGQCRNDLTEDNRTRGTINHPPGHLGAAHI